MGRQHLSDSWRPDRGPLIGQNAYRRLVNDYLQLDRMNRATDRYNVKSDVDLLSTLIMCVCTARYVAVN
jgi:hypothetical protein